jgi:hypothetical protein
MMPRPTLIRAYPKKTKDVNVAMDLFCNGCPIQAEYSAREHELKDMKHPTGAIIIGEREGNILQDPILETISGVCTKCLTQTYPMLLKAVQHKCRPWDTK